MTKYIKFVRITLQNKFCIIVYRVLFTKVSIPDLNFRLSYRDLKLFVAITQSLPFFQQSPELDGMSASSKNIYVDSKHVSTNCVVQNFCEIKFS